MSIHRRFVLWLALVTTTTMLVFSLVFIIHNGRTTREALEEQLDHIMDMSTRGLSSALWQYNHDFVDDYVEALFSYEDIVYVRVDSEKQTIKSKTRSGYEASLFVQPVDGKLFLLESKEVNQEKHFVGSISIAFTQERVNRQILTNSLTAIFFLLLTVFTLALTMYQLFRVYVANPLIKLENSAQKIAEGDLDTQIRASGEDEVGRLAKTLSLMMDNIKSVTASRDELNLVIAQRMRSDEALRESEAKYRLLAENTIDCIWIMNLDLDFVYINPAVHTMTGYSADEWIGSNLQGHCEPEYFQQMADIVAEALEKAPANDGVEFQTVLQKKNGDPVDVEIKGKILFDDDGNITGLQGTTVDITDRKAAERTLRESEERHRLLFENASQGIGYFNADGDIIALNTKLASLMNGPPEDFIGKTAAEFLGEDQGKKLVERIQETLESTSDVTREEFVRTTTGDKWLSTSYTKIPDAKGNVAGIQIITSDITARKSAEEEKQKLEEQFHQVQKMESIGRLAGGVAHDFNNMLSVILGHIELLLEDVEGNQYFIDELLEIQSAAKRSADLTRQLLAFARKQTIDPQVLDLNHTVEGMLKMLGRLIGEDIDLAWKPGVSLWKVKVDPSQLDQILANLCVNARDAILEEGKITIETNNAILDEAYCKTRPGFKPGEYVLLAVSDNGVGMDKATLEKIFEPFFSSKGTVQSTGLGLATVYGIVKQNKGFINVYSEPNEGTTFKIYMPKFEIREVRKRDASPEAIASGKGETVLLVEDEAAIMKMGAQMLTRLGYKVLAAGTPREAIEITVAYPEEIQLLLTDVVMPEMNGKRLAQILKESNPALKVLFMSGYTANVIAHHGVLDKGTHFLQKPFTKKSIADGVRKALEE